MVTKYERMQKFIPSFYKVGNNQMITQLVKAWAASDENVAINIEETKNQLFVRLASGKYLDYLGSGMGVIRPTLAPINDEQYREYILAAGYKPKTLRKLIYELLEVFWGPEYTHSIITSTSAETYNFAGAPYYLTIASDNEDDKIIKFELTDFAVAGTATAEEVCTKINAIYGERITAVSKIDVITNDVYVKIYTNTPGPSGSIQIKAYVDPVTGLPDLAADANVLLGFDTARVQSVECTIFEIYPKHLIIKIPALIPILSDLYGSHRFHTDATILDGDPPTTADPYWPGSFFYDTTIDWYLSETTCLTTATIWESGVINQIAVDDCSAFPNETGNIMLGWGTNNMDKITYNGRLSNTLLSIDPLHVFEDTWASGAKITLLNNSVGVDADATYPRKDGSDYPIYFIDTHVAQELITQVLDIIKAAGVILEFDIYETEYMYEGDGLPGWYNYGPAGGIGGQAWFQPPKMETIHWQAMIIGWGLPEAGRIWYDTLTQQLMMWNGLITVILA